MKALCRKYGPYLEWNSSWKQVWEAVNSVMNTRKGTELIFLENLLWVRCCCKWVNFDNLHDSPRRCVIIAGPGIMSSYNTDEMP